MEKSERKKMVDSIADSGKSSEIKIKTVKYNSVFFSDLILAVLSKFSSSVGVLNRTLLQLQVIKHSTVSYIRSFYT